ncbi:MAG TPA: metal ABC transporter ATP-binding protein [Geobacteraceae bacterium]|nr:metal ABC transporter ATP-binding protein [Geobacteraceae bacterium]
MPMNSISIEGLSFDYHGNEVLRDITCDIRQGDYVGIVGPNGSGKSTLIRCILGLNKVEHGTITLFGVPQPAFTAWDRIGFLPQGLQLFNPNFPATVEEVVRLGRLSKKRFPRRFDASDGEAVERAMDLMGISSLGKRLIGELSGGLRQRALLARALVNDPEVLILDEPTTALDPDTRDSFYSTVRDLNINRGTTILLITHDSSTIGLYASKLLYLDKRIIFFGTFEEFCHSSNMTEVFGHHGQHLICRRH